MINMKKNQVKKLLIRIIITFFIIHAINLVMRLPEIIKESNYSGLFTVRGLIIAIILSFIVSIIQIGKSNKT